jgi:hypothetical protein
MNGSPSRYIHDQKGCHDGRPWADIVITYCFILAFLDDREAGEHGMGLAPPRIMKHKCIMLRAELL